MLISYVNRNPDVMAAPVDYTNDVRVMAQIDNFISINNAHPLGDDLPVNAGTVPGVPGEVVAGVVGLGDLGHPHGNAAADLYVGELVLPLGLYRENLDPVDVVMVQATPMDAHGNFNFGLAASHLADIMVGGRPRQAVALQGRSCLS